MGTLVVNLVGCFLVRLLFYLLEERFLVNQTARTVVLIADSLEKIEQFLPVLDQVMALPQKVGSHLDTVSTGSGSDLVKPWKS